jgi:D-serine deaminase-like pyridoxal phosphate-dependent protein
MPQLLLDKEKCLGNMERMVRKANRKHLSLRPHCKTHQSAEISFWLRDFGVKSVTVSSFPMARYFADAGWKDILVAFPFLPGQLDYLTELSERCRLGILVDSLSALPFLNHIPKQTGFYIDIDTGYGRTGIRSENTALIEQILVKSGSNPMLEFRGFYCHAGHSYKGGERQELDAVHQKALMDLKGLKKLFGQYAPRVLFGDTPNCSIQDDFGEIDEITPGNFVFYDLVQQSLGACSLEDIAVAMDCPVAGRYPAGDRIVIHGGAIHFSKESLMVDGRLCFGKLVQQIQGGWSVAAENICLSSLSQEHGVLEDCGNLVRNVNIGDGLLFLPVHSCLTANLMQNYYTLDGKRITTMNS